jgi:beta-N-acetylhexosaminidase
MRIYFGLLLIFFVPGWSLPFEAESTDLERNNAVFNGYYAEKQWVDSVFHSLNFEERVAQLFMIRSFSNRNQRFNDSISNLIREYNIGGLTFFQGNAHKQAQLTNHWQSIAKTPLLISIDAEWGLAMRLDSIYPLPKHITLGAVRDNDLVYSAGYQIGEQCRRVGVQMNFAPVIDINSNPLNPVINFRSFGEDKNNVANKGAAFIKGMQDAGIIATAKHFPGHGDTDSDSHHTLPLLNHTMQQIDISDLFPFRNAILSNVGAIMVAHLFIPAIDDTKDRATSLSEKAVAGLLKDEMGYKGLVVTDALDMDGVTNYHKPGDIELMALLAGNDILLLPLDIPLAMEKINQAVKNGKITEEEINRRCHKLLTFKYRAGLDSFEPVDLQNITNDLNNPKNELITRQVFEKAITALKNDNELIPLTHLDTLKIATLSIGFENISPFQYRLGFYAPMDHYNLAVNFSSDQATDMLKQLQQYNLVIVSLERTSNWLSRNYGITEAAKQLIGNLSRHESKLILNLFGNPYALASFDDHAGIDAMLISYEDNAIAKDVSAQIVSGAIGASGRLPVTASAAFPAGMGMDTQPAGRLQYTIPEELGIARARLDTITKLIEYGISEEAYPGVQVLFAKDGKVFYHRAFGYHTYEKDQPVKIDDIYDLASITKVAATTLSIMQLSEQGRFDVDMPLSRYLPYLTNSNKYTQITREILAHQARFNAWIPFFKNTIVDYRPSREIYSATFAPDFTTQVANNLFINSKYRSTIFDTIINSALVPRREYRYSDLGFYLLHDALERITKITFEDFVSNTFYKPMGLSSMGYHPTARFSLERIAPTELDTVFRKQLVHGFVHDPGAAMLGGVSGHAGLFSHAHDVAAVMQMFLQGGYYGKRQYLQPETVEMFTRQQFPLDQNRRGMGFDKPFPEYDPLGPVCQSASLQSYGHSGFTGTYMWADPENGLLYVFLSNRVNPSAANNKISRMNIRTDLHQLMYDILNENIDGAFSFFEN